MSQLSTSRFLTFCSTLTVGYTVTTVLSEGHVQYEATGAVD